MPLVRSRDREALWKTLAKSDVDKEEQDADSGQSTVKNEEVQTKLEGAALKASIGSNVKNARLRESTTTTHVVPQSAAEVLPKLRSAMPKASTGSDVKIAQPKDSSIATSAVPQSAVGITTATTTTMPKSATGNPTTTASPALQTATGTHPKSRADPRGSLSRHSRTSERQVNIPRSGRPVPLVSEGRDVRQYLSRPSRGRNTRKPSGAVPSGPNDDPRKATQANNAADSKGDAKNPGIHPIIKQHERGGVIAPVLLDNKLPITKTLAEFKSGEPDPPVVASILERIEARTQKFANTQATKKVDASSLVNKKLSQCKPSPRKPSLSPDADAEDDDGSRDILDQFHENMLKDGKWWVQPIVGAAFPKRPEYSTWCQEGGECHGLKSFNCLMRHEYQADYWFKRKVNLAALPVDPDGLGSQDPPFKSDGPAFRGPKRLLTYTGGIKGAATKRDWAKARSGARFRRR